MKEQIRTALKNVNGNMTVKELHTAMLSTIDIYDRWEGLTHEGQRSEFQCIKNDLKIQVTPFGFTAFSISKKEKFIHYLIELRDSPEYRPSAN